MTDSVSFIFKGCMLGMLEDTTKFPELTVGSDGYEWLVATWVNPTVAERDFGGLDKIKELIQVVLRDPIEHWDTERDVALRRTYLFGRRRLVSFPESDTVNLPLMYRFYD